ncbi:MAG TPA: hypothetical protein VL501_03625 [Pyrinomonadaceae bacterium]|nr:hypothetical protein [Pyrinomonadaceae bacterium]
MVRTSFITIPLFLLVLVFTASAQSNPQSGAADKKATFASVAKTDKLYTDSIDAHDLDKAKHLEGQKGSFRGIVTKVFVPNSGSVLILNFDNNYKTALTAAVKKSDFSSFPDMSQLVGKEVVISGKFEDFHGATEILLTDKKQVSIVQ